jgi:hypothetical protein
MSPELANLFSFRDAGTLGTFASAWREGCDRFPGSRGGVAGRGRPPQAAARRAGLEMVEKPLTSISRPGQAGDHRPYRVPICCRVDQFPRSSSASSPSSLAKRLSVSLAVAPCSSAAKSRKSRYHLKLWIGFSDESAAYLPA